MMALPLLLIYAVALGLALVVIGKPRPVGESTRQRTRLPNCGASAFVVLCLLTSSRHVLASYYVRTSDVAYGRKAGMALTMDVFAPKDGSNGVGVIAVASAAWVSSPEMIQPIFYHELLRRGYTVFVVLHGSQPTFTIPDIVEDMHRAVRFIRYNAKTYRIDPERIGITGGSSGGHLSLMLGTAGHENKKANDPIDRQSSRVQAVGCFYAPTDFLNWGANGQELIAKKVKPPFRAAFDFKELDAKKGRNVLITDKRRLREIRRQISPIAHVTTASAPTLLLHGDKDDVVPFQQSEVMLARLNEAGVPAELIHLKGIGHGDFLRTVKDMTEIANWFDVHLLKKEGTK